MKEFNPNQFTPQTRSAVLQGVANSSDGIANPAHALLVGVAPPRDEAPMTFLSNRGLDASGSDFRAEVGPPADPKTAPINDKNGKPYNGLFVPPKGSGELHLDRKSFSRPLRGDKVKPAPMPTPSTTIEQWLADKLKPSGRFQHSRHASDPTDNLNNNYTPSEDDHCGMICDVMLDAIFNARFAKGADDRYTWLSSAAELMGMACDAHTSLQGGDE